MRLVTKKWIIRVISFLFVSGLLWNYVRLSRRSFESLMQQVSSSMDMTIPLSTEDGEDSPALNDSLLPDALQPVTFEGCCPNKGKYPYKKTCLTERACDDALYPFTSLEEQEFFQIYKMDGRERSNLRRHCDDAIAQLRPPTTWCSPDEDTSRFPMGCSQFSMGVGSGPYDRLLLFSSGKLAFCAIPKSGISQWLQFLRFTLGAKDYQSLPYFKADKKYFHFDRLHPTSQHSIWLDEASNWTKAMLIREPAERLLSAYLDKVEPILKRNIRAAMKARNNDNEMTEAPHQLLKSFAANASFAEFVDILAMENITQISDIYRGFSGISWRTDPHWRPQAWSCGLSEDLSQFDYLGTLDNAAYHTKTLLQQVGMWEKYGKHYRTSPKGMTKGHLSSIWPPQPLATGEMAIGFQQEGANDNDQHNQNSKAKLSRYYTPELLKKVKEIYWMDFELWEAVKQAEREGKTSGRDVLSKLKPECTK